MLVSLNSKLMLLVFCELLREFLDKSLEERLLELLELEGLNLGVSLVLGSI